jgi:predicted DCC family thiol-disulfide oxidoreductase YuxK
MWAKHRFTIAAWHSIPEQMAELGLSDQDGAAQAWFVDDASRLSGGAEAVNNALRFIWWARPFAVLYQLPLLKQIEDRIYLWVVANRGRLPGAAPSCERPLSKSEN